MMLVPGDTTSHLLLLQGFILTCVLMIFSGGRHPGRTQTAGITLAPA